MKIVIFTPIYDYVLKNYYAEQKIKINNQKHNKLINDICKNVAGNGDSFYYYLTKLGCEVQEFFPMDFLSQSLWLKENKIRIPKLKTDEKIMCYLKNMVNKKYNFNNLHLEEIAKQQIEIVKPDVIFIRNVNFFSKNSLNFFRQSCKLLVGHVNYKIVDKSLLGEYDLLITASRFLGQNIKSSKVSFGYLNHAFDSRSLKGIGKKKLKHEVVFIGGLKSKEHRKRIKLLEYLVKKGVNLKIWSNKEFLTFSLKDVWQKEVWNKKMLKVIYDSKVVLNMHSDVAGDFSGNMRMFEVTGMGSLLLTDHKKNNSDFFKVGSEIEEYKDFKEAYKKICYLLKHEKKRNKIALLGQKRTLANYAYEQRVKELFNLFKLNLM